MSTATSSDRLIQHCPGCGRVLRIPPQMKGQQVACKFCEQLMVAEAEEPPATASPHAVSHVGTGTAFQIHRTWAAGWDKESRYTVIKHPLEQPLRGYTMAVECSGPARVHAAGIRASDGRATNLGLVQAGEVRLIPLDDLRHAYLWLDKGGSTTVKVIVARLQ